MPKFTFKCQKCSEIIQKHTSPATLFIKCDKCGDEMNQQLPMSTTSEVHETIDQHTNVTWQQDQQAMLQARKEDNYWKNIVPRLVRQYSTLTALENGWVWIDDNNKVHVHDKPPSKR